MNNIRQLHVDDGKRPLPTVYREPFRWWTPAVMLFMDCLMIGSYIYMTPDVRYSVVLAAFLGVNGYMRLVRTGGQRGQGYQRRCFWLRL